MNRILQATPWTIKSVMPMAGARRTGASGAARIGGTGFALRPATFVTESATTSRSTAKVPTPRVARGEYWVRRAQSVPHDPTTKFPG